MNFTVNIYSENNNEIEKFLKDYYSSEKIIINNKLYWNKNFSSPFDLIDIISVYIDNKEKYNINVWISLDTNIFICVTENNINHLIKYIYERFPN